MKFGIRKMFVVLAGLLILPAISHAAPAMPNCNVFKQTPGNQLNIQWTEPTATTSSPSTTIASYIVWYYTPSNSVQWKYVQIPWYMTSLYIAGEYTGNYLANVTAVATDGSQSNQAWCPGMDVISVAVPTNYTCAATNELGQALVPPLKLSQTTWEQNCAEYECEYPQGLVQIEPINSPLCPPIQRVSSN